MTLYGRVVDERFWAHRQQSNSVAGIAAAVLALGLFEDRLFVSHVRSWDLLAVGITFVVIQLALMVWQHFTR